MLKSNHMTKFSVSGLRGVYGKELPLDYLVGISQGFARFMGAERIVLARDARPSGAEIYEAILKGLMDDGVKVLEAGTAATPAAVYATTRFDAEAGLVITASHNPEDNNGLKFLGKGRFLEPDEVKEFKGFIDQKSFPKTSPSGQKGSQKIDAVQSHVEGILNLVQPSSDAPRLKVGLDPVNGAAGPEARELLEELGCEVHTLNFEPSGRFGRGPEPISENLGELGNLVKEKGLDLGFGFDPDGDRLGFVDERGVAPGEEYTVPLCAHWALENEKGDVVVNLSTSRLIENVAKRFGVDVRRTPVGEAYVVSELSRRRGRCGGEGNGGFIYPEFNQTRDGLLAMAVLIQLKRRHGSLSDLVASLPTYHRHRLKLDIKWSVRIAEEVSYLFPSATRDTRDGLWLSGKDYFLHLRPSNTEPVVRLVVEAASPKLAAEISRKVREVCVE